MGENGWTGTVGCKSSDSGGQVVDGDGFVGITINTSH